ncbi:MAG: PIN domain-containing protein [Armatimonadota bacterium]|nr:PIN domain-containing protein [Armatimonadota bacterium]MDR7422569.1 PIN domain-containing protein [Armatimonadota bacterium]MDR7453933.1 PIN domain-containing protein [Armatimonadota bacterium]MDR7495744.1 PIN domain-containing protein [Armatimonadota bacterium]MDR7511039.1 PIN domain-containing protein [Armatimonadota bacterium]
MIFVDTAAFLAVENRRDAHHNAALAFRTAALEQGQAFVTSDYVLDETYTLMRLRAGHAVAVQFGEDIRASRVLRVEYLTSDVIEVAWRIFRGFADKDFSFTDCTSFALMERLGLEAVFTFDDHFRQYGRFAIRP